MYLNLNDSYEIQTPTFISFYFFFFLRKWNVKSCSSINCGFIQSSYHDF